MITTLLDNFYLTEEELEKSPSRLDGIDKETEETLRLFACEVIQEAVVLLKLPQVVAATGQVLLHRFLCKRSVKRFHIKVCTCHSHRRYRDRHPLLAYRYTINAYFKINICLRCVPCVPCGLIASLWVALAFWLQAGIARDGQQGMW